MCLIQICILSANQLSYMTAKILKEDYNNEVFLRPRFSIELDESPEALLDLFKKNLEDGNCEYCSRIVDGHIVIDVPKDENHYWSPQLHLEVDKTSSPEKAKLKGVFGPKTQVWTMFVFFHVALGLAFGVFMMRAYVHWSLDMDYDGSLLWMGVIAIVWLMLYVFARLGRRTGKPQTEELRAFMLKTLKRDS